MTITAKLFLFGFAWAALAGWATAQAQTAPAAGEPAASVQVANGGKRPIVAVYASAPGRSDWGDDMLGKGTLKPGQNLTLKFKAKPGACKLDFSALLDNGDTRVKSDIDLCSPQPSVAF
jgi:P pilus assembly chaperone PapD